VQARLRAYSFLMFLSTLSQKLAETEAENTVSQTDLWGPPDRSPPCGAPFHSPARDWAHTDQTIRGEPFRCVQGQVVLTNTSACFRCSPRSHLLADQLLDVAGKSTEDRSNWCLFRKGQCATVQGLVEGAGGQYQIPVRVPKGTLLLWLSTTVHSAQLQLKGAPVDPADRWSEWRGVVYVCYRPREDVDVRHCMRLQTCHRENRVSNHWGEVVFPTSRPGSRRGGGPAAKDAAISRYLENPSLVYTDHPELRQPLTDEVRALLGMES